MRILRPDEVGMVAFLEGVDIVDLVILDLMGV
jgi:hypothetical protein